MRFPIAMPLEKARTPKGTVISRYITICGNQPARYFKTVTSINGESLTSERVLTNTLGANYAAQYLRPSSLPPDAAAEAALRSLCPSKT